MVYTVSSLKIHCYSFSVNQGKSNMYQAHMTYNTRVVTISVLLLKRRDSADHRKN